MGRLGTRGTLWSPSWEGRAVEGAKPESRFSSSGKAWLPRDLKGEGRGPGEVRGRRVEAWNHEERDEGRRGEVGEVGEAVCWFGA